MLPIVERLPGGLSPDRYLAGSASPGDGLGPYDDWVPLTVVRLNGSPQFLSLTTYLTVTYLHPVRTSSRTTFLRTNHAIPRRIK
jgi:hypothetical protein